MNEAHELHWDVFISYASEDRDSLVAPLANALRQVGVSVWFDIVSEILKALSRTTFFSVLVAAADQIHVSPNSMSEVIRRCKFGDSDICDNTQLSFQEIAQRKTLLALNLGDLGDADVMAGRELALDRSVPSLNALLEASIQYGGSCAVPALLRLGVPALPWIVSYLWKVDDRYIPWAFSWLVDFEADEAFADSVESKPHYYLIAGFRTIAALKELGIWRHVQTRAETAIERIKSDPKDYRSGSIIRLLDFASLVDISGLVIGSGNAK